MSTKLFEWCTAAAVFVAVWLSLLMGKLGNIDEHRDLVLASPILLVAIFGLYSVAVIAYRVLTFNDCEEAAAELQKQISEAREDLRNKGFKFEKVE